MSLELTLVVAAFGLALALLSVRTLISKDGAERLEYATLLFTAMVFGLFVGRALHGLFSDGPWVTWPLGPLGGLALVELGPAALRTAKALLSALVQAVKRRLGGDDVR